MYGLCWGLVFSQHRSRVFLSALGIDVFSASGSGVLSASAFFVLFASESSDLYLRWGLVLCPHPGLAFCLHWGLAFSRVGVWRFVYVGVWRLVSVRAWHFLCVSGCSVPYVLAVLHLSWACSEPVWQLSWAALAHPVTLLGLFWCFAGVVLTSLTAGAWDLGVPESLWEFLGFCKCLGFPWSF